MNEPDARAPEGPLQASIRFAMDTITALSVLIDPEEVHVVALDLGCLARVLEERARARGGADASNWEAERHAGMFPACTCSDPSSMISGLCPHHSPAV